MKKTALFLLTFVLSLIMVRVNPTLAQDVAAYFFDEGSETVTVDGTGNGQNGTLVNGPLWVDGIRGTALQFDGVNDYVAIPYNLYSLSGGTLSLWFKKTGNGTNTNNIIGSWGGSGNQRTPTFYVPSTTLM